MWNIEKSSQVRQIWQKTQVIILLLLLSIYEFVSLILKYVIWDPGLGLITNENIVISRTIVKIT